MNPYVAVGIALLPLVLSKDGQAASPPASDAPAASSGNTATPAKVEGQQGTFQPSPDNPWLNKSAKGCIGGGAAGAVTGGLIGAGFGTVTLPVVGTVGGGALGTLIGGVGGCIAGTYGA